MGRYIDSKLQLLRDDLEDDISKLEFDRLSTILQGEIDYFVLKSKFRYVIEDYYTQDCYLIYSETYNKYVHSGKFQSVGDSDSTVWLRLPAIFMSGYIFLPHSVKKQLKSKVVFDFGGFDGIETLIFSNVVSKVFVFEPGKHFEKMKNNVESFNVNNVVCCNLAVSDKSGIVRFMDYDGNYKVGSRLSSTPIQDDYVELTPNVYDAQAITIDEFVSQNLSKDDELGLMKFDVEGAEYDAIQGGLETIKKYKPVMLISIYHSGKDMLEIKDVIKNLDLGYKFMLRQVNPDMIGPYEWVLICYVAD